MHITFISAPHLCSNQIWTELNNNNLALDEELLLTDRDYCVFCCFALWLSTQVTKRRFIRKYQISIWHLEYTLAWHIASSILNVNVFTPVRISLFRCSRYMVLVLTDTDETRIGESTVLTHCDLQTVACRGMQLPKGGIHQGMFSWLLLSTQVAKKRLSWEILS